MATRGDYFKSLNSMRENYNKQGNVIVNREDDSTNVGNDISSFAYMNTVQPNTINNTATNWISENASQINDSIQKSNRNGWQIFIDTIDKTFATVQKGLLNAIDAVGDFVIGTAGSIGKMFGGDDTWAKNAINYDWQGDMLAWQEKLNFGKQMLAGDIFTPDYWNDWSHNKVKSDYNNAMEGAKVHEISENLLLGVGEILPSIALGFATGGASLGVQVGAQATLAGVSSAGKGYSTAINDGADLDWRSTIYALSKGAIGAGTRALTSGLGGMLGQGEGAINKLANKVFDKTGSQLLSTVTRIGTRAGLSGLETTASNLAEPALRGIYDNGVALEKAYGNGNAWNTIQASLKAGAQSAISSAIVQTVFEGANRIRLGKEGYRQEFIDRYNMSKNPALRNNLRDLQEQTKENEKLLSKLKKGGLSEKSQAKILNRLDELRGEMEKTQSTLNDALSKFNSQTLSDKITDKKTFDKYFENSTKRFNSMANELSINAKSSALKNYAVSTVKKLYDEGIKQGYTPEEMQEKFKNTKLKDLINDAMKYNETSNNNDDVKVYSDSLDRKVLLLENKSGYVAQISYGKFKVTNTNELNNAITFLNNTKSNDSIVPKNIDVPTKLIGLNNYDFKNNKIVITKDAVENLKSGEFSLTNTKNAYMVKASNGDLKYVVQNKDGNYQVATIDQKNNEITNIENTTTKPNTKSYQIVPLGEDQDKYNKTQALDKVKGVPISVSQAYDGYMDNEDLSLNSDDNGEFFIYSKKPLYSSDFKKELNVDKINKALNTNISKSLLDKEINSNVKNPNNVIKFLSQQSDLSFSKIIKKLGYDAYSDDANSQWHVSDYRQIIKNGGKYKYEKNNDNVTTRTTSVSSSKQNTLKEIGKYFKDKIGSSNKGTVTKIYKEGEFQVKQLSNEDVDSTTLLKEIKERLNTVGVKKTNFLLADKNKVPCNGSFDDKTKEIDIYVDRGNEGTVRHEEFEFVLKNKPDIYTKLALELQERYESKDKDVVSAYDKYKVDYLTEEPEASEDLVFKEFVCDVYGKNIEELIDNPVLDELIADIESEIFNATGELDEEGDKTSEFVKKWYEKNGTPKYLQKAFYHSTNGTFNEFKYTDKIGRNGDMLGVGFYLTDDYDYSHKFGKNTKQIRVGIKNPIETSNNDTKKLISVEQIQNILDDMKKAKIGNQNDLAIIDANKMFNKSKNTISLIYMFNRLIKIGEQEQFSELYKIITKHTGYDGVFFMSDNDSSTGDEPDQIVVWQPNQLKDVNSMYPLSSNSLSLQRTRGKWDAKTNTFVRPLEPVKKEKKYTPSNQLKILKDAGISDIKLNQIKTWDKLVKKTTNYPYSDFTKEMANKALKKGYIKVYSDRSITNGVSVYTSKNQIQEIISGRDFYSKVVALKNVAWLSTSEGKYANPKIETNNQEPVKVEEPKKQEVVKQNNKVVQSAVNNNRVEPVKPKLNLPTYSSSGARMPSENEVIKNNGAYKHNRVYTIKNIKDVVNGLLTEAVNGLTNVVEVKFPTGKNAFINEEFKELNLTKDREKTLNYIVDTLGKAEFTFDNGGNGKMTAKLSEIVDSVTLKNELVKALEKNSSVGFKGKFEERVNKIIKNFAGYVRDRAQLYREYNIAKKNNDTLKKIFEDTRQMNISGMGTGIVNEIEFYKSLYKSFVLTSTGRPAPSSLKGFVDKFNDYNEDNPTYAPFYDAELKATVEALKEVIAKDENFGKTEPTLEEMQLYNLARSKYMKNIRDLIAGKKQERYNLAKRGTLNAQVATKNIYKKYNKLNRIADTSISFPVYLRTYLGANHPFTKLFFDDYFKVSSNASLKGEELRRFVNDTLSKEAGYKKEGELVKELKKKDYVLKDRNGNDYKISNDKIVSAYFIYNTNKDELLKTGLTAFSKKRKGNIDFKLNEEQYQDMFNHMPERVKKWADLVFEKYFNDKDYQYKNEMFKKMFGTELPSSNIGSYAPTRRIGQVNNGVGASSRFDSGYLSTMLRGFLKERVSNKNHFAWNSATDVIENNINSVTEWGEKSQWVEKIRTMLNTPIAEAGGHTLEKVLNDNLPDWNIWSKYMTKIVLGKKIVENNNPLLETITNAGQTAVLGLNVSSTLKQLISEFAYLYDDRVSARIWLSTIPKAISNFFRLGTIRKDLMENNGYFIERFDRGDVLKSLINGKMPNKIASFVLKPMEFMDSVVVRTHGYAIAEKVIKEEIKKCMLKGIEIGSKEYKEQVAGLLQNLVLMTQSNSDKMFMSRLRSGDTGEIAKQLFGLYQSDIQQTRQALKGIASEKIKSDKRRKAYEEASKDESYSKEDREEFARQAKFEEETYKKKYASKITKFVVAVALAGMAEVAISSLAKKIKGQKSWGQFDTPADFFKNSILEATVNKMPYINVIAQAIEGNSDVTMFSVQRIQKLVDTVKLVEEAVATGDSVKIQKAIYNVVVNGLELTGIPATNIYNLIIGSWAQFDKRGSIEVKSWTEGYSSAKMKQQYSAYIATGDYESAKAQLGAWASAYSASINDEATLNELVRLSSAGYNALPSANATSYTDDSGNVVSFTDKQATAFAKEYAKSSNQVKELLKVQEYRKLDDKTKASVISRVYKSYQQSAQAKATGVAPDSKLGQLVYYCGGDMNVAKYVVHLQNLRGITDTKTQTRNQLAKRYLNSTTGLTKNEKLLIAYLSGYSIGNNAKGSMLGFLVNRGMDYKTAKSFLKLK